ncbi:hypothetical protein LLB_0305 [Legionella longbeachae D-4968]|nr:hypothetical protein LLB_0305 [Legionella longbeachae D-4968]
MAGNKKELKRCSGKFSSLHAKEHIKLNLFSSSGFGKKQKMIMTFTFLDSIYNNNRNL